MVKHASVLCGILVVQKQSLKKTNIFRHELELHFSIAVNSSSQHGERPLLVGTYVACGFEAENFEELVANMIYKAGNFTGSWLKKHNIACGSYMSEMYFPAKDVAYMEMWYPVIENVKMEGSL